MSRVIEPTFKVTVHHSLRPHVDGVSKTRMALAGTLKLGLPKVTYGAPERWRSLAFSVLMYPLQSFRMN
eukprot:4190919-Pyramimonas_sp.AAC.1